MMDAPRNDLYRIGPPRIEARAEDDGRLTLFGHFSVFNTPTLIDSVYEGRFIERIAPGAFAKTIKDRGSDVKIMWNHGHAGGDLKDALIAQPTKLGEDERGGWYEAALFRGLPEWLVEGLASGSYGASFRFQAIRDEWNDHPARSDHNPDGIPERTVTEAKLLELGPVSWPAYSDATSGVRSLYDRFHDLSTPLSDAAPRGTSGDGAATTTPDAASTHLGGPTPRERRIRALQLRGVLQ